MERGDFSLDSMAPVAKMLCHKKCWVQIAALGLSAVGMGLSAWAAAKAPDPSRVTADERRVKRISAALGAGRSKRISREQQEARNVVGSILNTSSNASNDVGAGAQTSRTRNASALSAGQNVRTQAQASPEEEEDN